MHTEVGGVVDAPDDMIVGDHVQEYCRNTSDTSPPRFLCLERWSTGELGVVAFGYT